MTNTESAVLPSPLTDLNVTALEFMVSYRQCYKQHIYLGHIAKANEAYCIPLWTFAIKGQGALFC